jgi:hypothetical protein
MKDELWMRTWDEGHPRFSDDLHRGVMWLVARFRRLGARIMRRASTVESIPASAPQHDAA